jgi:DNA-binding winged helix-turn-helix (wHTH) protein
MNYPTARLASSSIQTPSHNYHFLDYQFDAAAFTLAKGGQAITLPPKAFDLLHTLVENAGQVLSRERLMETVWPDTFVEESNLNYTVSLLRRALGEANDIIETVPKRGYRFVPAVNAQPSVAVTVEPPAIQRMPGDELEPVGGAVPLDSTFYIARVADQHFHSALQRHDSIVLVKGVRQVGKTSLLARGLQQARAQGRHVVLMDLQSFSARDLESPDQLLFTFADLLARRLRLATPPKQVWDKLISANLNLEDYLLEHVLPALPRPLVWALDEVDRLFAYEFRSEIFGLFRSWHNARALEPDSPWHKLTLAMSYASEAHLFITDINQSPFNVGTRFTLNDLEASQVDELNERYGSPLATVTERADFFALVGGNPYLVRRGLHELVTQNLSLATLTDTATSADGPYGDHLRRWLYLLQREPNLLDGIANFLHKRESLTASQFHRLRSIGLLAGEAAATANIRCALYERYLREQLAIN